MNYDQASQLYNLAMNVVKNTDWLKQTIWILWKNGFKRFANEISQKHFDCIYEI